jgi:two-component system cell cycle sensor histidine kinase/response regulator CckA
MWTAWPRPPVTTTARSRRILIANDDPELVRSLTEAFGRHGYPVAEARDARSALREWWVSDGDVGAVLLDAGLPGSRDLQLVSAFRRLAPAAPVILMADSPSVDLSERALALGAAAVVSKPLELPHVLALVEWAMDDRAVRGRRPKREEGGEEGALWRHVKRTM